VLKEGEIRFERYALTGGPEVQWISWSVDKSFVSDEFLQRESDIIYKVRTAKQDVYIYVLVEFQSTVDKTIPVRMLLYILQLYDQLYRDSRKGKLPAVFPVLLYNGSEKWTVPDDLSKLIEPSIPARYIPSFQYYPIIENEIPDRVLKKIKGLVAAIIFLENQKDEAFLSDAVTVIIDLIAEEQPEQLRMFSHWLNRMFRGVLNDDDTDRITHLTEVKSMLAQLVEKIEKRGVRQGMQEGALKARKETARNMLQEGLSIEQISRITGLSQETIKDLG
jgi:predicted transposase/invertase (TIGR01784 family)